jgi:hypothetical protein
VTLLAFELRAGMAGVFPEIAGKSERILYFSHVAVEDFDNIRLRMKLYIVTGIFTNFACRMEIYMRHSDTSCDFFSSCRNGPL